mgnify:CR=1 FL=1
MSTQHQPEVVRGDEPDAASFVKNLADCPRTQQRIHYLARKLRQNFGLGHEDEEDLVQSCWLKITRAFVGYDPERSRPGTFASRVADLWYCEQARRLRNEHKRPTACDRDPDLEGSSTPGPDTEACLRIDVELALHRLPPDLAAIARSLGTRTVAEIARAQATHRSTIHRKVQQVRAHMRELQPGNCGDSPKS